MTKRILIVAFLLLTVLTPNTKVLPGLPMFRGEDLVVALLLVYGILLSLTRRRGQLSLPDRVTHSFQFLAALALISIAGSELIFGSPIIMNDMMILPMLLKYWIAFRLAQSITEDKERRLALWAAVGAITVSATVCILQLHNLLGVNDWLTPRYVGMTAPLRDLVENTIWARAIGTHGDPRFMGCMLVIGVGVILSLFYHMRSQRARSICILALGICMVAVLYTLSRTTVISLGVTVLAGVLLHARGSRQSGGGAVVGTIVIVGVAMAVAVKFSTADFESRVLDTQTDSFQISAAARHRDLMLPFKDAMNNPTIFLIGRGPAKASLRQSSNNDYTWFFHRFGLGGLAFYLLLLYQGLRRGLGSYRAASFPGERAVLLAAMLVIVNWTVFAMAESLFKDSQVMALNMFFLGLLYPARPGGHAPAIAPTTMPANAFGRVLGGARRRGPAVSKEIGRRSVDDDVAVTDQSSESPCCSPSLPSV